MHKPRVAIIGAGNGGQSFAAHLGLLGFEVRLYDIELEKVEALKRRGKITISGAVAGEARIPCVTNDIREAIRQADLIMVVVPTVYHAGIATAMAPHLEAGQVVVLNPGATGGALEVRRAIRREGCTHPLTIAETNTLLYACRSPQPGEAIVHGVKDRVELSALPAVEAPRVAALLNTAFPQFSPVPNILYTSLANVNAMVHPAPTLLNAGRIECRAPFEYYSEGVTPSLARICEVLDGERLAIAQMLGLRLPSIREWYAISYGVTGDSLYEQIQKVRAYDGIKGPITLNTRYLFEDIPTGLVPLAELGEALGVKTPMMRAVVELGGALLRRDFWREGRSLEKLGLAGMGAQQILQHACQ